MDRSALIRKGVAWTMLLVLVLSLVIWNVTRERLPREIRVATASQGGLYHSFAQTWAPHLQAKTGVPVTLLETEGTRDNRDRLLSGEAEFALLQAGAIPTDGLSALAPLYHDVVFIVARKNLNVKSLRDLAGHRLAIGTAGSGMRASAEALLTHYNMETSDNYLGLYFLELLRDETLDAAVITTGFVNPDLEKLLGSGLFEIIPIRESHAFCLRNPSYERMTIPCGLYGHGPSVPLEEVETVATTAFLATRADASDVLVAKALDALYRTGLRSKLPTLMSSDRARTWRQAPLHPAARNYFDPYGGIDTLASFMESLAAGKELLFALAAGLYLLWDRYRRIRERERQRDVQVVKDRLDELLAETARIERAQMDTTDAETLKQFLDEVTRIKLTALDELTHEDLRGDRMFLIFLIQCGNVINKIQAKIPHATTLSV